MSRVCRMGQAHHLSAAVLSCRAILNRRCSSGASSKLRVRLKSITYQEVVSHALQKGYSAGQGCTYSVGTVWHRFHARRFAAIHRCFLEEWQQRPTRDSTRSLISRRRTGGQQRDALNSSRLAWRAGHSAEAELQYLPFLPGDGAVAPMLTRAQLCTNKTPTAPKAIPRKSACRNAVPRAKSKYREARRESPPGVVFLSRKGLCTHQNS